MNQIESTQRTLVRSQRSLELLEMQAAGFGQLHIPVHVQLELEEKRAEIKLLQDRLTSLQSGALVRELLPEPALCPYPGMQPFKVEEAQYFYGRDPEIKHLLQHLRHQHCIFVIGPSGSGKSSLVFAGLLPALQSTTTFPRAFWAVRVMRPGAQPVRALAELLGGSSGAAPTAANLLAQQPAAQRLLLVIDQFEELFTQAARAEQATFVAALQALRGQPSCALIITMRADFYPDLMSTDLWPVEPSERLEVAPLRGPALRRAITQPAVDVGVELEPALVDRLLDDAHNEPGSLPLIQETMQLLWAEMDQGTLTLSVYEQLGSDEHSGLAVAVATKADATLSELIPAQRQIARRVFLSLVQPGAGIPDTRRQRSTTCIVPQTIDTTLRPCWNI
jgi:energy-coupling factor transporter ATP-binding protein EcfA2